jgi:hypothetical protein
MPDLSDSAVRGNTKSHNSANIVFALVSGTSDTCCERRRIWSPKWSPDSIVQTRREHTTARAAAGSNVFTICNRAIVRQLASAASAGKPNVTITRRIRIRESDATTRPEIVMAHFRIGRSPRIRETDISLDVICGIAQYYSMVAAQDGLLGTIHPFAEGALGILREVAWNALAAFLESEFTIRSEPNLEFQRVIDERFQYALKSGGQALLDESYKLDCLDLLLAFERLVRAATDEYAVVALSTPEKNEPLVSLFVTKGGPAKVAVPSLALRQIDVRLTQKHSSKVIYVHNHPQGILHNIFGTSVLGPSAQDRDMIIRSYQRWFGTGGLVNSEFYLVEGGSFRKFTLPSAADVWQIAKQLGIVDSAT